VIVVRRAPENDGGKSGGGTPTRRQRRFVELLIAWARRCRDWWGVDMFGVAGNQPTGAIEEAAARAAAAIEVALGDVFRDFELDRLEAQITRRPLSIAVPALSLDIARQRPSFTEELMAEADAWVNAELDRLRTMCRRAADAIAPADMGAVASAA